MALGTLYAVIQKIVRLVLFDFRGTKARTRNAQRRREIEDTMGRSNWKRGILPVLAFAASFCLPGVAGATPVLQGLDYFHTLPGTHFDFGAGIGDVAFEGGRLANPFDTSNFGTIDPGTVNLGNADTVVERLANANVAAPGDPPATIPIEMVALSLRSVDPVSIGGSFFDVFVELDPSTPSTGSMTINHDVDNDNGTIDPEGTFVSAIDLFFDVIFSEVGGTGANDFILDLNSLLETVNEDGTPRPIAWTHERPDLQKPEFPGETNFFLANFFMGVGVIGEERHRDFAGLHRFEQATIPVPEPGTLALFGAGLAFLAAFSRGRKAAARPPKLEGCTHLVLLLK